MRILTNQCWGGFGVSTEAARMLPPHFDWSNARTDETLISLLEEMGSKFVSGRGAKLSITEIPDNATDWMIDDYDGMERVIYVLDGKLHPAYPGLYN